MTQSKLIHNEKGFTLVEVMVASSAAFLMTLGVGVAFVLVVTSFQRAVARYQGETEINQIVYSITSTLSRSTNMHFRGRIDSGNRAARNNYRTTTAPVESSGTGILHSTARTNDTSGNTYLISVGNTETIVEDNASRFNTFGIFFQAPTTNRSGAIYIDRVGTLGTYNEVTPRKARERFYGITQMTVDQVKVVGNDGRVISENGANATTGGPAPIAGLGFRLLAAEFHFVLRKFLKKRDPSLFRFCPNPLATGPCTRTVMSMDLHKRFRVNFTNNYYNWQNPLSRRALGNVYMFKSYLPRARGN